MRIRSCAFLLLLLLSAGSTRAAPGLSGVVLDAEDGRPLPGAEVRIVAGGFKDGSGFTRPGSPVLRTKTDADGKFRFDALPEGALVTVTARAPGRAESCETVDVTAIPAEVRLLLKRAASVHGTVVSPDGKPMADVRVYAVHKNVFCRPLLQNPETCRVTGSAGTWEALKARTDAAGKYRLDILVPGEPYHVFAEAPGLARSEESVVLAPAAGKVHEHRIRLRRFSHLVVTCRDADGGAVDEVRLSLRPWRSRPDARRTDPGVTRFESLAPGDYVLIVKADAHLDREIPVLLPEGETTELEVRLTAGVSIEGLLVDDLGRPVSGVEVSAARPVYGPARLLPDSSGKTVSDATGRFRIEGLSPGPHDLVYRAPDRNERLKTRVTAPDERLRLILARSAGFRCRLVLPEGARPPRSLWIRYRSGGRTRRGARLSWPKEALRFLELAPGEIELMIDVKGYAFVLRRFAVAPGKVVDLGEVRLGTGVSLSGTLVDPDGRPVSGAFLEVGPGWSTETRDAVTDERGRFRLDLIPEGPTEIRIWHDDFLEAAPNVVASADPLVLTLHRGGLVRGRVTTSDGKPAADVEMALFDPGTPDDDDRWWYADTDETGAFEIRVPPGRYRLAFDDDEPVPIRDVTLKEGDVVRVDAVRRR